MLDSITINKDNKPIYDIIFESSFDGLLKAVDNLNIADRKICIITDSNVAKYHLNDVLSALGKGCDKVYSFSFEAGEPNKNLSTIEDMYAFLIERHFDRNDILFALGGGVVGDMTGFLAATYLRGIRFVQIPTSLLAMVDSSIGGKTGVDFKGYKNMVGAFHMPSCVYINPAVLDTLPERDFISGFAEIIKHAIIKDAEYFDYLSRHSRAALDKDYEILANIIYRSCLIKKSVVEEDPTEKGIRALLNFGHTIGHAIEKYYDFKLMHGECVSLGCICSLLISKNRMLITDEEYDAAVNLFAAYGLPVCLKNISDADIDTIMDITKNDKKSDKDIIKFILARHIGNAFIDRSVTASEMSEAIASIVIIGGRDE